jgi:hypothetical protein
VYTASKDRTSSSTRTSTSSSPLRGGALMSLRRGFVFGARLNIALHVQRAQQLSTLGVISNFFPTSKLTKDDASRFPKTIADLVSQKLSETTKLSPETIDSMVVNAIEIADHKTLEMLLHQSCANGQHSSGSVERVINFYLQQSDVSKAATTLTKCAHAGVFVSKRCCQRVLESTVNHCMWDVSLLVIGHMIDKEHAFDAKHVFFTVGGLMSNSKDVGKVLGLMELIVNARRLDLAEMFSYRKVKNTPC